MSTGMALRKAIELGLHRRQNRLALEQPQSEAEIIPASSQASHVSTPLVSRSIRNRVSFCSSGQCSPLTPLIVTGLVEYQVSNFAGSISDSQNMQILQQFELDQVATSDHLYQKCIHTCHVCSSSTHSASISSILAPVRYGSRKTQVADIGGTCRRNRRLGSGSL